MLTESARPAELPDEQARDFFGALADLIFLLAEGPHLPS